MSPAILVTGASRGIGEAVYRRLTRDGYPVIGTYHTSSAPAARLAEELEQEPFVQVDLADEASVGALLDGLRGRPLKALVNNAGTIEFETFGKFDLGIWRRSFAVHCDAALKLALGLQEEIQDGGSIINITSTDAFLGGFDTLSYAASKSALDSLTKSLAINLGPRNIRANAIAPGWIDTLDPWPDVVEGLTRLKRRYVLATLSNGNVALIVNMAKRAGLAWDAVLGAEVARCYKPQPGAYLKTAELLGLAPGECMMVAAHNDDLRAAHALGFRTAFVRRALEYGPNQTDDLRAEDDFDVVAESFIDLADALGV